MYVCGITPYDATHLGHAATYVAFDTLQRVLRDSGANIDYCQNVTDVDDPLLARAAATGEYWVTLAERETELFRQDMTALRVLPPRWYVGAVDAIPEIIELIADLRDRGATYEVDGDLYFPVSADPHFGSVANLDRDAMLALSAERGGDPERPGKKDPLDPLLWRAAVDGEPAWPSPFGPGRPGWHVECTAIALRRLGSMIDIQGGGSDLAYPHHELSAAHADVATGSWPFARFYVHTGMVGYGGEKMSKSRGNLVLVSDLRRDGVEPSAIRLALLAHRYRADWEYADADRAEAAGRLARWRAAANAVVGPSAEATVAEVRRHLADDLDTPRALAALDRWAGAANRGGTDREAPVRIRDVADALLGVTL
jgi:L-cysteine:1D-myo-inositol 2-amino-2-deoxy-alpha-D-glucopyranoside ligase